MSDTNTTVQTSSTSITPATPAATTSGPTPEQLTQAAGIKANLDTLELQKNTLAATLSEFKTNLLALNEQIDNQKAAYRAVMGKQKRSFGQATKDKMAASAKARWAAVKASQAATPVVA